MKIAIGSDHAGYTLKSHLILYLEELQHEIIDVGTNSKDPVDYPDYGMLVCQEVLRKEAQLGVLICGTGIGVSIAANRHKGIRAALCNLGPEVATLARKHNDANVLCLGGRLIDLETAKACLSRFIETAFEGGRHQNRIDKIEGSGIKS